MRHRLGDDEVLLAAWEYAVAWPTAARPAALVAFDRDQPVEEVLDLPLARSTYLAAAAYVAKFGSIADCTCTCPSCAEVLGVPVDVLALAGPTPADPVSPQPVHLCGGDTIVVRELTTRALLDAARSGDPASALRAASLRTPSGEPLSPDVLADLAGADLTAIEDAADRLAGPAGAVLRMRCPACDHDIRAPVDIAGLLWERVDATIPLLLTEVAALASAFGWQEADILGLGTTRRHAYLRLLGVLDDTPDPAGTLR
jgi:hypothetical protein